MEKLNTLSIVCPCYNEENNVFPLYERLQKVINGIVGYEFEIIFIDNSSTDETAERLRELARLDSRVKVIINARNFGHNRSPFWALLQTSGEAAVIMAADLQDPPEYVPQLISEWEKGWKVVMAQKPESKTGVVMHALRKFYYWLLNKISSVRLIEDANGFGIYDKKVIAYMAEMNDPNPYIRGMVCEIGFPIKTIKYVQDSRHSGSSKNNLYALYDQAMLGFVSHSVIPLRVSSAIGFLLSGISFLFAIIYLGLKLSNWDKFSAGIAPIIVGGLFIFGLIFIFLGLLGEYIASIQLFVKKRPMVVEQERINF